MNTDLSPLIAATSQWLTRAFPSEGGAYATVLAEIQARQAVRAAAWLRYPTVMDAALVIMAGPGGSARLDWITGTGSAEPGEAWRSWVDEVVASWAACLLTDPHLAEAAVQALAACEHTAGPVDLQRLLAPDAHDVAAAALLRHPDLLDPIAALHRAGLVDRLRLGPAVAR